MTQTEQNSAVRTPGERRFRHVKRGTEYRLIGRGKLQQNGPADMADMVIYQDVNDGSLWVRSPSEFYDGRFKEVFEEARGAAEQRRKDGEGQEVAYYIDHRPGSGSPPYAVRSLEQCAFPEKGEPVYTHPANVAALEARIAELEGERERLKREIQAMRPGSVKPVIHSPTRFMDDARATPTREGGV